MFTKIIENKNNFKQLQGSIKTELQIFLLKNSKAISSIDKKISSDDNNQWIYFLKFNHFISFLKFIFLSKFKKVSFFVFRLSNFNSCGPLGENLENQNDF